ncbi:MAG: sigma-70 family RNA polymerase sigma factor [Flavobacteriales bacterium]|nr:sigma-70 family RNA polymerase sigma factor [Flavobacteriales bacterium]
MVSEDLGHAGGAGTAGLPCPTADAAAVAFVRSYRPAIDWAIRTAAIPRADRNDLVQDITIKVLERFRRHGLVNTNGSNLSYAIAVARSCAFTWLKMRKRTATAHLAAEADARLRDVDQVVDDQVIRQDGHARLRYAIASLTPFQRYLMERVMDGATPTGIARENGWSEQATRKAHRRAVKELRKRLVPR